MTTNDDRTPPHGNANSDRTFSAPLFNFLFLYFSCSSAAACDGAARTVSTISGSDTGRPSDASLEEPGLPTETTDSLDLSDGWPSVVRALCGDDTVDTVADRDVRGDFARRNVFRRPKGSAPVRPRRSLAVGLGEVGPFVMAVAVAAVAERRAVSIGVVVERLGVEPLRKSARRYRSTTPRAEARATRAVPFLARQS